MDRRGRADFVDEVVAAFRADEDAILRPNQSLCWLKQFSETVGTEDAP